MKILVSAEAFGYGPISTALEVSKELLKNDLIKLDFIGSSIALEQAKLSNMYNNIYECDTNNYYELSEKLDIIKKYDAFLSSENVAGAIFAINNGIKNVYYIDNLMWMWDKIPDELKKVKKYFISEIIQSYDNFNRIGKEIDNPIFVGPIRDINISKNENYKNQLIINIGGASSFLLDDKLVLKYYNTIINNILECKKINKFENIVICGGGNIINNLDIEKNDNILVKVLQHDEYLKKMEESSHCILAPGLGNFIETIGKSKNILFLPPINYSQFLQINYYRNFNLGIESLNWNDFDFYRKIDMYLPEEQGVNKVVENVKCFLEGNKSKYIINKVEKFIDNDQKKYYKNRIEYINSFDKNSAYKISSYIINDLKYN